MKIKIRLFLAPANVAHQQFSKGEPQAQFSEYSQDLQKPLENFRGKKFLVMFFFGQNFQTVMTVMDTY